MSGSIYYISFNQNFFFYYISMDDWRTNDSKKKKKKTNGLRKTRIYLFIFNPKKKMKNMFALGINILGRRTESIKIYEARPW